MVRVSGMSTVRVNVWVRVRVSNLLGLRIFFPRRVPTESLSSLVG